MFFAFKLLAQKGNIVLDFPNSIVLYSKYSSILNVGFTKKRIKHFYLECQGCDTLYQQSQNLNEFVLIPGDTVKIILELRDKKTDVVVEKSEIIVQELPKPTLKIDNQDNQIILKNIPEKLNLENQPNIPIVVGYVISNWTIKIQDKLFTGSTSKLSEEIKSYMKLIKNGIMIIDIEYISPYGKQKMMEIFEFEI